MTPELERYFAALHARSHTARKLGYCAVSNPNWTPQPNHCHENVDYWVKAHPEAKAVRGWLIRATDGMGGYNYAAHSVIEEGGELFEITPGCEGYPFVEHPGTEKEFLTARTGRSEQWYPPPTYDPSEESDESNDNHFDGGY